MAKLKNELKWSHTRQKNWEKCKRLYYLAHYAHWHGWERDADDLTRQCYRLTKMQNLPMFAGSVVHDVIEAILKDRRSGHTRSLDEWREEVPKRLNAGWKQSKERLWERDPKRNVNLFEHFHGLSVDREDIDRTRGMALTCIDNFFASEAWGVIHQSDTNKWRALEELRSLQLGEHGLWIKIDFAMEDKTGCVWLFDWKTGRRSDEHLEQLLAYALYANREWKIDPDNMQIVAAYLRENESVIEDVTIDKLDEAASKIEDACAEMARACDDPVENTATMENFPMTDNRRICAGCFFQSICYDEGEWPCKD